jgi:hypothetical protein
MKKLALAALLALSPALALARETVPFIDDDYTKALAQAKMKNVPIFVEAWAPW